MPSQCFDQMVKRNNKPQCFDQKVKAIALSSFDQMVKPL